MICNDYVADFQAPYVEVKKLLFYGSHWTIILTFDSENLMEDHNIIGMQAVVSDMDLCNKSAIHCTL